MSAPTLRLRSDVRLLPLVNRWYAWLHLIAPHSFALVTKRYHLPLLESYLEAPEFHQDAARRPELRGGPFIDHDGDPGEMRRFLDETMARCSAQLALSSAIQGVFRALELTPGMGLSRLASELPPLLQGTVELIYDAGGSPGLRFIEEALYRGPAWSPFLQSCMLQPVEATSRRFVLSTPILQARRGEFDIQAPFADPVWDWLSDQAGLIPGAAAAAERLGVHAQGIPLLQALLEPAPVVPPRQPLDGLRIRYFGHACVLLESNDCSVLVDPLVSYRGESSVDRFTLDDLPAAIDYVLITHGHQDHLVLETLLRLRGRVRHVIVPRAGGIGAHDVSLGLALRRCGFRSVHELGEYETLGVPGGRIVGLPFYGEHGDLDVRAKLAYAVTLAQRTAVFLADSNPPSSSCYDLLREIAPTIDALFIGMECVGAPASWLYGPVLARKLSREEDQARRLNGSDFETAWGLVERLAPRQVFVYAMGAEPWITHLSSIVYSDDLPQFRAARRLLAELETHSVPGKLLFGKHEVRLPAGA